MMNKRELLTKYKHRLTLKNFVTTLLNKESPEERSTRL